MPDNIDFSFAERTSAFQPWLPKTHAQLEQQRAIQDNLRKRAGAKFGCDCFISPEAQVLTEQLTLGDRSWIASGAIVRGYVHFGCDCSVNPYAHIAGNVRIGNNCRIAGGTAIYGFNHGIERVDIPIKDQPVSSRGITIGEDVWIGANAVIVDGVSIGSHCVIAGGSVVSNSFPPYQIIGGNPARIVRDRRKQSPAPNESLAVRKLLFSEDPYMNPMHVYPEDLQGWGSSEPIFQTLIERLRPRLIVEVGSWKGASAIHMAGLCKRLGLQTEIVCVDTWLGNWQHWNRQNGVGSKVDLRIQNGFPMLYFQFLSNVIARGYTNIITPLPLTGVAAAKLFEQNKLSPDLIYIDGDHEYEAVNADIRAWVPLLSNEGVILGDDYDWPGVQRAATEFASANKAWNLKTIDKKFTLTRMG